MSKASTHQLIIEAADTLFYEQGYERTSFAHISEVVGISRGNFYHHFKTKSEILDAVIEYRIERTRKMLRDWQAEGDDPKARIQCFIKILQRNWGKIRHHGCPVGSLTTELSKLDHEHHAKAAEIFCLFRAWLSEQFKLLGCGRKSEEYANHVLAFSQGVATLASALNDKSYLDKEVRKMCSWVDELEAA
jgi:TetR/AcrR family transcriptional repressor of nem operon